MARFGPVPTSLQSGPEINDRPRPTPDSRAGSPVTRTHRVTPCTTTRPDLPGARPDAGVPERRI